MNTTSAPRCPKCGDQEQVISRGKKYSLYPSGCMAVVGFPFAVIHQASCPTQYECRACGAKFERRSNPAKLCLGVFIFMILWSVACIIAAFVRRPM